MTPNKALFAIYKLMDSEEWSANTLDQIAEILTMAGYKVRDLDGEEYEGQEYDED